MNILLQTLFLSLLFHVSSSATSSAIPDALLNCYRSNVTQNLPNPPLTTKLLIEIIRKLEHDKSQPSIRILTNSILHTVKFDGVQRTNAFNSDDDDDTIIPYRAKGKQFYKFKFLVDHLTPGDTLQFPKDAINDTDLCVLHSIISNTIDLLERGDERDSCNQDKLPTQYRSNISLGSKAKSNCPLEKGVIKSRWGTISAGHLLAGIASALQKDTVKMSKLVDDAGITNYTMEFVTESTINNLWFATIIGDLAEVLINQRSKTPKLGLAGYWNDTLLPRRYFLDDNYWDMSEAKLIGGIDGLILGTKVTEWVETFSLVRFSQLIDMYYSERGIGFDRSYRACERNAKLTELLNRSDMDTEVATAASLLQMFGSYDVRLNENDIKYLAEDITKSYKNTAASIMETHNACEQGGDNLIKQEIIVIFDETWFPYDKEKFLSYLCELTDVSYYGSKIGVINGENGAWMTNITSDLVQLYQDLQRNKNWPTRLSLTKSLHSVIFYYQNKTETCNKFETPYGNIILVMAQSTYLTDNDKETATASVESIRNSNPDTKILYVTSGENSQSFKELTTLRNAMVLKTNNPDNVDTIVREISNELSKHPANIINFYCRQNENHFEDYITPGLEALYEIRGEYVSKANISVKFKGNGYGDISICAYDAKSMLDKTCKGITVNSEVTFNIKDQCSTETPCTVQFAVLANNSAFKCSEVDCRYPDQVRIDIHTTWNNGSAIYTQIYLLFTLLVFLIYFQSF